MRDMLQIAGGFFITVLLTALILSIFRGIIYFLVIKARENPFFSTSAPKV
jgi:hypothetical protein